MRVVATLLLMFASLPGALADDLGGLPEVAGSPIGYASPAAALSDLRSRPGVTFSGTGGVIYAFDEGAHALWMFSRVPGSSLLSAVKQEVVQNGGRVGVRTSVLCGGPKAACDGLVMQSLQRLKSRFPQKR